MKAVDSLKTTLDPILVAYGFSVGQGREDDDADIIWCADYTDFRSRFPRLPQAKEQRFVGAVACVDLTVRLSLGQVVDIDLEAHSLADTFGALGRLSEARQSRDLLGSSAATAATRLGPLLVDLFGPRARGMQP